MNLIEAAKHGDFTTVFSLLEQGHQADVRDHDNATPLYWSACHGHTSLCELLLQAGCDVNARVKWGSTPLHAASDRGRTDCVTVLIENGADVNCQNNRGDTALHIAAYRGNMEISQKLLRANTDKTLHNDKGKTPKDEAIEGGHKDIADCIAQFTSGKSQGNAQSHRTIRHVTPFRPVSPVAPPLLVATTNGFHDSARPQSFGGAYASSLTESACSYGDSSSDTDSYDYTDSSTVDSTETACVHHNIPLTLKRSLSVGGHDITRPVSHVTSQVPHLVVAKTHSVGNIIFAGSTNRNIYENDVNKGYSSLENTSFECSTVSQCFPYAQSERNVQDFTSKLTSNGRCIATESVDESTPVTEQNSFRRHVSEMTPQSAYLNRPLRASTGSVCNSSTPGENREEFIKTLQKQLVNAYKDIERLVSEKDDLKFKCSTVINRLTDTEQQLEEKMRECENLRELLNTSRVQITGAHADVKARLNVDKSALPEGMKSLVLQLNNELKDIHKLQTIMQKHLLSLARWNTIDDDMLEPGNREWVPGVDYVIIGEKQVSLQPSTTSRVPMSVKFLIKHLKSGRRMILKMLLFLESPVSSQCIFNPVPLKCEKRVPDGVLSHYNVAKSVHKFEGLTDRFRKFVIAPESKRVQLCSRTTFVVTGETKTFRTLLESIHRNRDSKNRPAFDYGLFMEFMLQVTYQLLSLVCVFEEANVFHGNISEDSVIFDKTLRPLLSDFEVNQFDSSSVSTTSRSSNLKDRLGTQCVDYGNCRAANKSSDDLVAVCCMVQRTLFTDDHMSKLKTCDQKLKHTLASIQQVLQKTTRSPIESRTPARSVLHSVGCILFGPRKHSVQQERDCGVFIQTQVLRLTFQRPESRVEAASSEFLSVPESVTLRRPEVEAYFLCNISSADLWDAYQCCQREGWLVS